MHQHRPAESAQPAQPAESADAPTDTEPLSLPPHPPPAAATPFPVVASVAPALAALAIWAITRSPYALVFAAFGPVVAAGGVVDGRWQARRRRRRDEEEQREALEHLAVRVRSRLAHERDRLNERHPSATSILAAADGDATRWRPSRGAPAATAIRIGTGPVPSGIRLEGVGQKPPERELALAATTLADAPITCDAADGVGVLGPRVPARAVARGYLVQLAHALSPPEAGLTAVPEDGWEWARALPHFALGDTGADHVGTGAGSGSATTRIEVIEAYADPHLPGAPSSLGCDAGDGRGARGDRGGRVARIALADALERLPTTCRTVLMLEGVGRARLAGPEGGAVVTELVSTAQAEHYSVVLSWHARTAGLGAGSGLPHRVRFSDLFQPRSPKAQSAAALACVIGIGTDGPVGLDLVRQGPHAVVGGTTGSGKSELLTTWVTAMAAGHGPNEVTFLLVDFKGGAAFAPLATLPHCVGVMTDLDHVAAARALASLGAELRSRERTLARFGAADIADPACADRLPRLVIVVDEFAAMLDALPELQSVLTDIAARGRSLGVHLILCTQRPAGAMRDALLANCGLRLSLRVNNRADSQAVVGTDAAASLPQSMPGRCIVGVDGLTTTIQVATTSADDIARVRRLGEFTGEGASAPQPWLDPLPDMIPLAGLAPVDARDFVLGVEDVPEEQRQDVVSYRPERDGSLLVLGVRASGATTLLACLAAQPGWPGAIVSIGSGVEEAWDAVCDAARRCASRHDGGPHLLLLADDIDSLHARLPAEHQQQFAEMLTTVLRDGPAVGVWLVATAQRLHGQLAHLATLFGEQLLMRLPNRQEHALAGGDPRLFDERMPAGGALWRGHRVQLAWTAAPTPPAHQEADCAPILEFRPGIRYLLVSRSPRSRADQLRAALGDRVVVTELEGARANGEVLTVNGGGVASVTIGDPDTWQAQWALLAAMGHDATMIFDGCSLADVRILARTHTLPPPLGPGPDRVWLCDGEGDLTRGRLPGRRGEGRGGDEYAARVSAA